MKYIRIMTVAASLACMAQAAQAQTFKVFRKDGTSAKVQASALDSIAHDGENHNLTLYMKDGRHKVFDKAETDSVVWYDPAGSLIGTLKKRGNYTTFLRLLQDIGQEWLDDHLEGAGGASLFVADDSGWKQFFADNAHRTGADRWRTATSYEALTYEQKQELLSSAVVTADYLPESYQAEGNWSKDYIAANRLYKPALARSMKAGEMPYTNSPVDKDYWQKFRSAGKDIMLSSDIEGCRVPFFTPCNMTMYNITEADLQIIFPGASTYMAGGVPVKEFGANATNGQLHTTSAPLVTAGNMADVIRTNGRTDIFSHMLDRYCAPFYDEAATAEYRKAHPDFQDSIFNKRYFSDNSAGHRRLDSEPGPDGTLIPYMPYKDENYRDIIPSLKFDPGWNGYWDEFRVEQDMAAMFVPSDEALWKYFTEGGGMQLIRTCYNKEGTEEEIPYVAPTNHDELFRQIDYIPLGTLQSLINTIMIRSFIGSVPSKMTKLRDDAQEQLFYPEDVDKIDTCILACNGAVYIMDEVYVPTDYMSVTSPVYIGTTNNIMKWAIYNGCAGTDYMGLNYYAYLKAMQSRFTVFLPSDAALQYYYDPVSMKSRTPRVFALTYRNQTFPIQARNLSYYGPYNAGSNPVGTIGNPLQGSTATFSNSDITNRLKNILESHTICDNQFDISGRNEYFLAKNGNVVKVIRDFDGRIAGAQGTMQLENERNGINSDVPGVTMCKVTTAYSGLKNGETYILDAPLIPTYRSLWSILTDDMNDPDYNPKGYTDEAWAANPFRAFYELCTCQELERLIKGCGLVDGTMDGQEQRAAMKRFRIFCNDGAGSLDYNFAPLAGCTPFTAYIPTNEAVERAVASGKIPTWEEITDDFDAHCGEDDALQTREDSLRIREKITRLRDIVMSHFYFDIVIADQESQSFVQKSVKINHDTMLQDKLDVKTGYGRMSVTDKNNRTYRVTNTKNLFFCDYSCNKAPRGVAMTGISIESQRPGVVHQIDGVMGLE